MASEVRLLPRTKVILKTIRDFMQEHQMPPTLREIQTAAGISSTSLVDYHLVILEREGYLERMPGVSRGITLTQKLKAPAQVEQDGPLREALEWAGALLDSYGAFLCGDGPAPTVDEHLEIDRHIKEALGKTGDTAENAPA